MLCLVSELLSSPRAADDLLRSMHGGIAILSGSFILVRGTWLLLDSPLLRLRWLGVAPQLIDTWLLLLGVGLSLWSRQYPFVDGWLTMKLTALVAYIPGGLAFCFEPMAAWQRVCRGASAICSLWRLRAVSCRGNDAARPPMK